MLALTDGTRRRCSLESALPAMPPKWRPRFSADYLATRPKRDPANLLPQALSGRLSPYSPNRASIPESEASISNHAVRHNSQITQNPRLCALCVLCGSTYFIAGAIALGTGCGTRTRDVVSVIKPKRRSWILAFSRKERKDRKAYRYGGVLQDFQAYPLF